MDNNQQGNLGEAKVMLYLVENGYEVYLPFGEASTFDIVAYKDNQLYRVSVKSTRQRYKDRYKVNISQSGMTMVDGKRVVRETPFDPNSSDILAIYIVPEDKIVLIESKAVTTKTRLIL